MRKIATLGMLLVLSGCAGFKNSFVPPDPQGPVQIADKFTAFAIITKTMAERGMYVQEFDYGQGEIKSTWVVFNDGLATSARTKMRFNYNDDQHILAARGVETEMEVVNTNPNGQNYFKRDGFLKDHSAPRAVNPMLDAIDTCAKTPSCVEKSTQFFSSSFFYNYLLLRTLTEVGRTKFIDERFKGKEYSFSLPLVDLIFNKDPKHPQKYVALFSVFAKDGKSSTLYGNNIFIKFYTNNENYVDKVKQEGVKATGKLLDIDKAYSEDNFNFYIEDTRN